MHKVLCSKNEKITQGIFLALFLILISILTLFGISPILNSILNSAFYITLLIGLTSCFFIIKNTGYKNFVGRFALYFFVAILLSLINKILLDINLNFIFNKKMWLIISSLLVLGSLILLTSYKLNIKKITFFEAFLVFVLSTLTLSIFTGMPQIINSLLITTGIISFRIAGQKINCGITLISIGLITMAISNLLFIERYWSQISYFGDISDVILLLSWTTIVSGIYFIKRHHA